MKHKYIVKDWADNEMNWGEFKDFEEAQEAIDKHVNAELKKQGIDIDLVNYSGLNSEYDKLDEILDRIVGEYRGEYFVDEIEPE